MGFITWNDHYSVKVPEIDDQHKKLIALANQLYDAMRAGKGRDVLGPVLTELVEYTAYHFESEERLMLQHAYPEHDEHKELHDSMAEKARQLRDDFRQGQESRAMDVMLFLSNWLNIHILEVDMRYAAFLSDKGVS
jgi:hemerythrin-like metal-binding protein